MNKLSDLNEIVDLDLKPKRVLLNWARDHVKKLKEENEILLLYYNKFKIKKLSLLIMKNKHLIIWIRKYILEDI